MRVSTTTVAPFQWVRSVKTDQNSTTRQELADPENLATSPSLP